MTGANVVGYFRTESGVGQAARLLLKALAAAGIPHSVVRVSAPELREEHAFDDRRLVRNPVHPVNVICINADQLPRFAQERPDVLEGRWNIGVWAWEVETFPTLLANSASHLDEIWVHSRFAHMSIAAAVAVPVYVFPLPYDPDELGRVLPGSTATGEAFQFLFCFDYRSVFERKNPLGVVEAYCRAFPTPGNSRLLIKSVNADADPDGARRLAAAVVGRSDIALEDGYLDRRAQLRLMAACDAYISLHRSEGFGLTVLEARAMAKPVVTTAYSGVMEFVSDQNAYLVPFSKTKVPSGCEPYPAGSMWAEPDLDAASSLLREIFTNPGAARNRGARAADDVCHQHAPSARGAFLNERLSHAHIALATRPKQVLSIGGRPQRRTRRVLKPIRKVLRQAVGWDAVDELQNFHAWAQGRLQELDAALNTAPYTSPEANLDFVDPDGRLTLGYSATSPLRPEGGPSYRSFEDVFRGPEEFIRLRQAVYIDLLADRSPVADLGCGRGELLDLFAGSSTHVIGIDSDPAMAARCRDKGHAVIEQDALDYLASIDNGCLGAIFSAQFVEHLAYPTLSRLLSLSHEKLSRDGKFIAETVNLHSVMAWKTFPVDPTHVLPLFPETLLVLCQLAGFSTAYVLFPNGTGDFQRDRTVEGEYAVVATR